MTILFGAVCNSRLCIYSTLDSMVNICYLITAALLLLDTSVLYVAHFTWPKGGTYTLGDNFLLLNVFPTNELRRYDSEIESQYC
jgi:hypothetical protein